MFLMLFTLLSLFIACQSKDTDSENQGEDQEEILDCSADFRTSANINIVDQEGASLSEVEISYTVDGEEGTYIDS